MGMTFRELIDYAKKEEASDVHVTVGTNIALRRFGNLEIMEPAPSAEEATELIFSELSEEQIAQVKAGEDLDFALMTKDGTRRVPISTIREIISQRHIVSCVRRFRHFRNYMFRMQYGN